MPDQSDVREIAETVRSKRRFDARDWDYAAEYVINEWERRKAVRKDLERHWKEIDRQVEMEPDRTHKMIPDGKGGMVIDNGKMWMSEIEPPLQAQALEVLVADARRMMFPDSGPWFQAHAEATDDYLSRVNFQSLVLGDENEVPSEINQDNADKLVEGFVTHLFRQTDIFSRFDRINAEAFKYGMGVGRARMETKNVYLFEARGVRGEKQRLPVLVPSSIKNHYLDDPMPSMHSSQVLGPAHIAEDWLKLENLRMAAAVGSSDPNDSNGGWMGKNVAKLEPNDDGYVHILEMEGDLVFPRKTVRSLVIPGAIITVAIGGKAKSGDVTRAVIRFRFRKSPFSSYLLFPYHHESACEAYSTSPLMKGRPVQIAVAQALNRLMDSAALRNAPPTSYDRSDTYFSQNGGPIVHPFAQWGTIDGVNVHTDIGGDPSALGNVLAMLVNLYSELTGILPARLGAQTVSHTTAFAKDAELSRGAVRTVDYVRQVGHGAVTQWLDMAYQMGRDAMGGGKMSFYIEPYGGFVNVRRDDLPENSMFEWHGSGGPAEEQQAKAERLQAMNMALQMDVLNQQLRGEQPKLDMDAVIQQILRQGGWTDVDVLLTASGAVAPDSSGPGVPALAQGGGAPAVAALQAIQGGAG